VQKEVPTEEIDAPIDIPIPRHLPESN
jgi:hypothetical protein